MEKPSLGIVSKSIRTIGIGFLILCVGIGINKIGGQVGIGVIVTFSGFFVVLVGLSLAGYAVVKSWFS